MSARYDGLITPHHAEAAIAAHRFVAYGANDGGAKQAIAGERLIGVSTLVAAAKDETVDVVRSGVARIEYGGAVARGDPLASDADGKAVVVGIAGGTNYFIGGYAEVVGVSGDIGSLLVMPSRVQG